MSTYNVDDYSVAEGEGRYAGLSLDMMYPSSRRKEGRQFVIMYPTGQVSQVTTESITTPNSLRTSTRDVHW